ncbi:hypothetical protein ADK60_40410 [Streptomyces sp. XY431]|uniref:hypothetical protein n=1 Tax=Streptomyces sp. XY431 TaxID=1415562 RepID=UPI0006B006F0|nr:hypothetical protein [Streptomyces sp. XY431]KOV09633.1 hypothetical protein ADK60_40410 [Streptomyces sp. XY431]
MTTTSYAAQLPRTQVSAMGAMLAAVITLLAVLTNTPLPLTEAGRAAAVAYGAVAALAVLRFQVRPMALLLSTARITAALVIALVTAPRTLRARRQW